MASKISEAEAALPVINMAEMGTRVAARRAELGLPDDSAHPELVEARNSGTRRTPSQRALLMAIVDTGGNGEFGGYCSCHRKPVTVIPGIQRTVRPDARPRGEGSEES